MISVFTSTSKELDGIILYFLKWSQYQNLLTVSNPNHHVSSPANVKSSFNPQLYLFSYRLEKTCQFWE